MKKVVDIINTEEYTLKFDQNGKMVYGKNKEGIEIWFDKNENIIRGRCKDGYELYFDNEKIVRNPFKKLILKLRLIKQ